jgi:diketogulonate reductase-like aldo/keto reductase
MSALTIALNNGNKIPWIAFGTGTALWKQDAQEATTLAIQTGFVHLDGAQIYGNEVCDIQDRKPSYEIF